MTIFFDTKQSPVELPEGEKVEWRISAYAAILSNDNKILLMKPTFDNTKWVFLGGGIEINESLKDGVERECYEEAGYKVKIDTINPIYCGESNFYDNIVSKKFYHSLILVFPGKIIDEKQNINIIDKKEVDSVEWVSLEELNEENCHKIIYPAIRILKGLPCNGT